MGEAASIFLKVLIYRSLGAEGLRTDGAPVNFLAEMLAHMNLDVVEAGRFEAASNADQKLFFTPG